MRMAMSELQARVAGSIGEGLAPAVVEVAAADEDDARHALLLGALGDDAADHGRGGGRAVGRLAELLADVGVVGRRRGQGVPGAVVDHLHGDVMQAAEHGEARARGLADDGLAHPAVTAVTRGAAVEACVHGYLPFPALPDLPAL